MATIDIGHDPEKPRARNVFITDEQWSWVLRQSQARKVSMSTVVRDAIDVLRGKKVIA